MARDTPKPHPTATYHAPACAPVSTAAATVPVPKNTSRNVPTTPQRRPARAASWSCPGESREVASICRARRQLRNSPADVAVRLFECLPSARFCRVRHGPMQPFSSRLRELFVRSIAHSDEQPRRLGRVRQQLRDSGGEVDSVSAGYADSHGVDNPRRVSPGAGGGGGGGPAPKGRGELGPSGVLSANEEHVGGAELSGRPQLFQALVTQTHISPSSVSGRYEPLDDSCVRERLQVISHQVGVDAKTPSERRRRALGPGGLPSARRSSSSARIILNES